MRKPRFDVSALSPAQKREYVKQLLKERASEAVQTFRAAPKSTSFRLQGRSRGDIPRRFYDFAQYPEYRTFRTMKEMGEKMRIANPFFRALEGVATEKATIDGKEYINYANYNFLGLCGHPDVNRAAKDAIDLYGSSVSASRIVSGQRPIHVALEREIAGILGVDDSIVFPSGFVTNVTTIGHLFGPKDLILHDELLHNSAIQGSILSGARRIPFPHNDWQALDRLLTLNRRDHERVVIVMEGQYSMDGDAPDPRPVIEIKSRHKTFLMIDEAHSMGVMGEHGFGVSEYFGVDGKEVDIWMGTLSKSFASCGGYIAGCRELVDYLRYSAPAAVYSAGISPPNTASALAAFKLMKAEPERVRRLNENARLFLELARARGLNTGKSMGFSIVPVIVGSSVMCILLSNALRERGINVQPILHPAVEESATRLRFFFTCGHTEEQIRFTVDATTEELQKLRRK